MFKKKRIGVSGVKMAYIEEGTGRPIVFLHGNPTSSFLWRHIIPYVANYGRVIAPDLIGMGDSDKLTRGNESDYYFIEHRNYLSVFLEKLDIKEEIIFVLHDWSSALGFDWISYHPQAVSGVVYMEAIVKTREWADFGSGAEAFQKLRSSSGEKLILEDNFFIEALLPAKVLKPLSKEVMAEYRRPYPKPQDRLAMLAWPRQLPIAGEPVDVVNIINH